MRVSRAQSEYWIPARRICGSRAEKIDQIESAIQELLDIKLLESIDAQPNLRFLAVPRRSHWFGMTLTILALLIVLVLLLGTRQAHPQDRQPPPRASEPFDFADFTWLSGNPRTTTSPLGTSAFTGEFRVDTHFMAAERQRLARVEQLFTAFR